MGLFKPDAPKAPDPYKVAEAQKQANIETAQAQQKLGMVNQQTDYGSQQWVADPTAPGGYRMISSLSPEEQALLGQRQDTQALALGNVGDTLGADWSLDAARGNEIGEMQRTFLDPQWADKEEQLRSDLFNRGIREGSEQWDTAMRNFGSGRDNAYNSMWLDAWSKANDAALTERNLPMQDYAILAGLGGMQTNPQFGNVPQPGVAATDLTSGVYNQYKNESDQYRAGMGGLFGLGSSLLGGWANSAAGSGLINAGLGAIGLSDERAKDDIKKVGEDPRGWGVYVFRYKGAEKTPDAWRLGYMAQEVEKVRPDAVVTSPSTGLKFVNYEVLAQ
jgi:hypothetical protein